MPRFATALALVLSSPAGGAKPAFPEAEAPALAMDVPLTAPDAPAAARLLLGARPELGLSSLRHSLTGEHVRYAVLAPDGTRVVGLEVAVHLFGAAPDYRARLLDDPGPQVLILAGQRRLDAAAAGVSAQGAAAGDVELVEAVAFPAGPGVVRPGYRVIISTYQPAHAWEVWVDADDGAAQLRGDTLLAAEGTGMVYRPNPVITSGDDTLFDNEGMDSDELTALREQVTLLGLDDSGYLRGDLANVHGQASRVMEPTHVYDYTRSQQPGFDEVNVYYHVNRVNRFLQTIGFTGARAILDRPFEVVVNYYTDDNSRYEQAGKLIRMGTGGVDDAEDGDVLAHEYGHAVMDDVVPRFGASVEAGAIGEGFADMQAYSVPTESKILFGHECLFAWDARCAGEPTCSYLPGDVCLRRVDGQKHYPEHVDAHREVHNDGEIFSGTIFEMYQATGLGPQAGYQLLMEALHLYSPSENFAQSAQALILADQMLNGGMHEAAIRRALTWHGLLADITPPSPLTLVVSTETMTVESEHPIGLLADKKATVKVEGAEALRVHFASIDMETDPTCPGQLCDAIYLYDENGLLYAHLGGLQTDVNGPAIPGDTVVVRWVSDRTTTSNGFVIDKVDVLGATLPDAGVPDAAPLPDAAELPDVAEPSDVAAALDASPAKPGDGGGCGCQVGAGRGARAWWAVLGLLTMWRARAAWRGRPRPRW